MARRLSNLRPGVLLLALAIALILWGIAHGRSDAEQGFDVPVELRGLDEAVVVTDQSVDVVNVRVRGSRAALRNLEPGKLKYTIDLTGAQPGVAEYEVDASLIDLPRSTTVVSRSPYRIQIRLERQGRRSVTVRADIEGEPAEGFRLGVVRVEPSRVWLAGARSQVLRLSEVVTEPIDLAGLKESEEREVRLFLGGGTVWVEDSQPVTVTIEIEADLIPPQLPPELNPQLPAELPEESLPAPRPDGVQEQEIG